MTPVYFIVYRICGDHRHEWSIVFFLGCYVVSKVNSCEQAAFYVGVLKRPGYEIVLINIMLI